MQRLKPLLPITIVLAVVLIVVVVFATGCSCGGTDDGTTGGNAAGGSDSAVADGAGSADLSLSPEETEVHEFFNPFQIDPGQWAFRLWFGDWRGDLIYSISTNNVAVTPAQVDMLGVFGGIFDLAPEATKAAYGNTVYACGETLDGHLTVCPIQPEPMPEGEVIVVATLLDADVPMGDMDHFYTYAVVFDSDGDTTNNFEYMAPYDWDYYQGTDRWYELNWSPQMGAWQVNVSAWNGQMPEQVSSAARVVIDGRLVVFFIPVSEFAVSRPGFRATAFAHDGTYAPDVSAGDVSGADPTEPLLELPQEAMEIETVLDASATN